MLGWKVRENLLKDDPFTPSGIIAPLGAPQMRGSLRFPVDLGEANCRTGRNRQKHCHPIVTHVYVYVSSYLCDFVRILYVHLISTHLLNLSVDTSFEQVKQIEGGCSLNMFSSTTNDVSEESLVAPQLILSTDRIRWSWDLAYISPSPPSPRALRETELPELKHG